MPGPDLAPERTQGPDGSPADGEVVPIGDPEGAPAGGAPDEPTGEPRPDDDGPPGPPDDDDGERAFPVRGPRLGLEALATLAVSWLWAAWSYDLSDLSPRVPLHSVDDARLITNLVKNTADQGWWTTNPDLGYPVGQQLYDFPHGGETWQLAILRVLSLFTDSPGLLMNTYFFVGIGVAGLAAFLALRHLRFGFGLALVAGTALTWLPFRLGHGQYHLFRTSFWWVPLAFVVLLWMLHWRERFLRDPDPPARPTWWAGLRWNVAHNLRRRRVAAMVAMLVVLGGSETMTTAFTLTLLALTGVVSALRHRDPATLLAHALAIVVLAATVGLLLTPTLRFVAEHGTNSEAGRRLVTEQEQFGLKISALLLPDPSHRWEALGRPAARIRDTTPVPSEAGSTIGLLGAAGFLGATYHALTHGWGRRRRDPRPPHDRAALRDDVGLLVVLATLVATVSGGAILLSLAGFSQVRVWNRMSLIIAIASLAFALTWCEAGWRAVRARLAAGPGRDRPWTRTVVGTALVVPLLGFVLWDGANVHVDHAASDARWVADADYVAVIDEVMPDGSAVFQFPVVRFPEQSPPGTMHDYDHLRGWVHTPPGHLRWSYGAMKGRPDGDWQLVVRDLLGESGSLPALLGLGFDGVWVDTFGYDDGGARVRAELDAATGVEPIVSADRRTLFYDLRPLRDRLAAEGTSQADLEALAREQLGVDPGD